MHPHPRHQTHAWLSAGTTDTSFKSTPVRIGSQGGLWAWPFLWLTVKDPEKAGVQLSWQCLPSTHEACSMLNTALKSQECTSVILQLGSAARRIRQKFILPHTVISRPANYNDQNGSPSSGWAVILYARWS